MSQKSADIIRDFLDNHNLTITRFAKEMELSRYTIYKYLKGEQIHPKAAKKIENNILKIYREFIPAEKLIE